MLDTGGRQTSDSIPVMRTGFAFLLIVAAARTLEAQQGAPLPTPDGASPASQDAQPPLTPEQQLEQQIRQVDPLAKSDKELKQRDKSDRDAEKRSEQDQTPTPGSIAAGE